MQKLRLFAKNGRRIIKPRLSGGVVEAVGDGRGSMMANPAARGVERG